MSERQKKRLAQKEATKQKKRMIEKVLSNSRTNKAAFNLNFLVDGWLELESDPGTFSLLIEDFGCYGAQVDEIYDLDQKFEGPIFGFIFLFKWVNNQTNDRSRSQKSTSTGINEIYNNNSNSSNYKEQPIEYVKDENIISEMFFAKQMISNSCATHALISILLNCDYDELSLGPTLKRLKEHTRVMNPENKGYAIGNLPELAKAHNSHASYSSLYNRNKPSGMSYMISGNQRTQKKQEAYHFVSYVPINNRLYELDGLKEYPIDHGPFGPKEDWTEKFRAVIKKRLLGKDETISNDIRYNLMAVVPDKRVSLKTKLKRLNCQHKTVRESIKRLTERVSKPLSIDTDIPNPPYSPLSNATLTADEGSNSELNSPALVDDSYYFNEKKVEKYFLIKFDTSSVEDDSPQPAHSNCIIEIESTDVDPINLIVDTNASNEKDCEISKTIVSKGRRVQPEHGKEDGDDNQVKLTQAHNNIMYNLSGKPPFDFNILDEMQHVHHGKAALRDLQGLSRGLSAEIEKVKTSLKEEVDKRRKYKIDNSRRAHNYQPFIMTFLSMLAKHGKLADLIEKDLGLISATGETTTVNMPVASTPCKTHKSSTNYTTGRIKVSNGESIRRNNPTTTTKPATKTKPAITKPKYKYVSTGRPVGRPRKNPLVTPPVKASTNTK